MKTTFTAVLSCAVLCANLSAQEVAETTQSPAAPTEELTEQTRNHVEVSKNILLVLRELTTTLETVQNKTTADEAAGKVLEIAARMQELQNQAENIPALTREQEELVRANINEKEVQETVHNFLVSVVQMAQVNCYESEAMSKALTAVLSKPCQKKQK